MYYYDKDSFSVTTLCTDTKSVVAQTSDHITSE